jgi:hypothetical protein
LRLRKEPPPLDDEGGAGSSSSDGADEGARGALAAARESESRLRPAPAAAGSCCGPVRYDRVVR